MEQKTNTIIEGSNYYKTQSVASISKIMTCIIALEHLNLEEKVYLPNLENTKKYGSEEDKSYLRVTIVDENGKIAYSRAYFVSEILEK